VHSQFEFNLNGRYNGAFNTQASNGGLDDPMTLDSNVVVDLSGKYHLTSQISLTAQVINVFDEVYAAARVPAGFRPGHPFGIYGGVAFRL
jgi:Fe(3+) dicitrate transport protein